MLVKLFNVGKKTSEMLFRKLLHQWRSGLWVFSVFPSCSSLKNCLPRGENIFRQLKHHSSSSHIHGKKICEPLNIHPKLPNQWITFALSYLSSTFYHKVTRFSIHINPTEKQQQTQQKKYYIVKSFFYVGTVMCW